MARQRPFDHRHSIVQLFAAEVGIIALVRALGAVVIGRMGRRAVGDPLVLFPRQLEDREVIVAHVSDVMERRAATHAMTGGMEQIPMSSSGFGAEPHIDYRACKN